MRASGTFEVKLAPLEAHEASIGRRTIDKIFSGDLIATSKGEMLAVMDPKLGSGVYVALERVSGTLVGKQGAFALAHRGVMDRGAQSLTIEVVPDSGAGELAGLKGTLQIIIEDGKHSYVFDYELA
ncbi:MAG TPA: DUF3224 domain-containing protein [Caulobacterales bacterium]|nr:DUF3224 domain-containing protein [Caulobacterales bacterium]